MIRTEKTTVASGVIGEYFHKWEILRIYDNENNNECFDLLINKYIIGSYNSIVEALKALIAQFED